MNRNVLIIVCVAGLSTACGQAASQGTGASPSASPAATAAGFQCKLPIAGVRVGSGYTIAAGFVSIPQGSVVIDANGQLISDGVNGWHTVTKPELHGSEAFPTYDQAQSRWTPALPVAISPDGSHYTYMESHVNNPNQPIHVVDVATGADRIVYRTGAYDIAAYAVEGIYLVHHPYMADGSDGLWLLNPDTGVLRRIGTGLQWQFPQSGSAWSTDVDSSIAPPPQGAKMPANRVMRLDLSTGKAVAWLSAAGKQVQVIGTDGRGHPFVEVFAGSTSELLLASSQTDLQHLFTTSASDFAGFFSAQSDEAGRVWLVSNSGISLYQPGEGLRQMVNNDQLSAHGLGLAQARPAGPCISIP